MIIDGYIKGLAKVEFETFIKLLGLRVLKNIIIYTAVNLQTAS
jgi:hypothetical protein